MNQILFPNYLKKYIFLLTNKKTVSIAYLYRASKSNARIIDPLILYCVFNHKTTILDKYTNQYHHLYQKIKTANYHFDNFPDYSFNKIYDSFLHEINRNHYDNDTKVKMYHNIHNLQQRKKVSNYRIYTDLKLNPGNINAFLKNQDPSKLSLETARRIINYLSNY